MGQNPTEDELNSLVMELDIDGNGLIDFEEFIEMMRKNHEVDHHADLRFTKILNNNICILFFFREAFKIFDNNQDGYIDMSELKKMSDMVGAMLTKEEMDDFMAEADKVFKSKFYYIIMPWCAQMAPGE